MHPLTQIATLTGELAQAAAEADWDRVWALDTARYAVLEGLPASCLEGGDTGVQFVLEQALIITNAVRDQARHAQHEQAGNLRGLQRAQRGAQAYLSADR